MEQSIPFVIQEEKNNILFPNNSIFNRIKQSNMNCKSFFAKCIGITKYRGGQKYLDKT